MVTNRGRDRPDGAGAADRGAALGPDGKRTAGKKKGARSAGGRATAPADPLPASAKLRGRHPAWPSFEHELQLERELHDLDWKLEEALASLAGSEE